jgi:hypothetical protein
LHCMALHCFFLLLSVSLWFPSPQFLFSDAQCLLFLSLFRLKPALSYLILVIQAVKTKDCSSLPSCLTPEVSLFWTVLLGRFVITCDYNFPFLNLYWSLYWLSRIVHIQKVQKSDTCIQHLMTKSE